MRNNEERMGAGIPDRNTGADATAAIPATAAAQVATTTVTAPPPTPAHVQQSNNPLLNFVSPTDFVELPSKGRFYSQDHPLHNATTIEIKHMTTKEEEILTSEALLRQGIALDRFVSQIIVDKRINLDSLTIGDKNAILVAARISGYGANYQTNIECPSCQKSIAYEFNLEDLEFSQELLEIDKEFIVPTNNGTFIIKELPVTRWSVEVKPLTSGDEKRIMQSIEARKKRKLPEDALTTQMSAYVVSISDVTDRAHINEAINNMPAMDSKFLRMAYGKIIPNVDMSHHFTCSECDHSGALEVPFTTDFFWPQ